MKRFLPTVILPYNVCLHLLVACCADNGEQYSNKSILMITINSSAYLMARSNMLWLCL
jgi:hypothetical protein